MDNLPLVPLLVSSVIKHLVGQHDQMKHARISRISKPVAIPNRTGFDMAGAAPGWEAIQQPSFGEDTDTYSLRKPGTVVSATVGDTYAALTADNPHWQSQEDLLDLADMLSQSGKDVEIPIDYVDPFRLKGKGYVFSVNNDALREAAETTDEDEPLTDNEKKFLIANKGSFDMNNERSFVDADSTLAALDEDLSDIRFLDAAHKRPQNA